MFANKGTKSLRDQVEDLADKIAPHVENARDQIGPLLADNAEQALALVNEIVRTERGPLLIDAVNEQADFLKGLTNSGWSIERPFQRMRFGRPTALPAQLPFAVAGPEFG